MKTDKYEYLENKYEIETLEPNDKIKDWFKEFEKDIDNLIKNKEKEMLDKFEKLIDEFKENTFGDKKQIINEGDIQSGKIEFSYTGELYPIEKLEISFLGLIQKLKEMKNGTKKNGIDETNS